MNDPLFDDCSIEIIRPEAEGNLRQRRRERYPIGFDMRKVVQHQTRNRDGFQIIHARGNRQVRIDCMLRMKRQGDKAIESTRFILQLPQPDQMIDTFFEGFDVPVEHRCIGTDTCLVHASRNIEPSIA